MGIPAEQIISLNKSRQRAVYWRRDSHGNWVRTTPLPADPASIHYYFSKGFKATAPEETVVKNNGNTIKCPLCEFEAKDAFGLQAHLRKHIGKKSLGEGQFSRKTENKLNMEGK